jgi:hypothetical protein
MKLLPRGRPFWNVAVHWDGPVFRIFWIGWWQITYDLSHMFYIRWPHTRIWWNDD